MDSSSRFIVPLDTFDLKSLLNQSVTKNLGLTNYLNLGSSRNVGYSDIIPIWSKKSVIDTNDYYEFEIKRLQNTCNEDGFVRSQCSKTIDNTEYCYICNIPVPADYMQLHNAGVKHRTCAAILSHALHRANQHMTQSISLAHTDPTAKTQSAFEAHFCDECATVINKEIKEKHETTEEHIKAVKHDRQLQAFLALFTDKVVIEDNNKNVSNNNENGDEILKHEDLRSDTLNLREEGILKDKIEEVEGTTDCDKPYKAATVDYKEDFVLLKTLKGELLRIPTDNYQGFSRLAHDTQCRVCREMVVDTAAHKAEPRHVELVTAAVADKHCIRPLNDMLNHCILCNDIIYDPLFHSFNNKQHNILLEQCIVPSNGKEKEGNTEEHYCTHCNLIVERALKKRHKKSLDHRLKMWNANTGIHHHLKATEVLCEILCKVCNIVLENNQECLDEHLRTFDHEKNYDAILVSNKIRKIGDCLSFCQICNIRLVDREELHHIAGAKHVAKIQKWQESVLLDSKKEHALLKLKEDETVLYDSDVSDSSDEISADELTGLVFEKTQPNYMMELSNDDQVKCKVCDVKMENEPDIINKHIETNNHKFNYNTILNYNKLTVIEGSNGYKFYCEYCKGQVKEKSEIDHINDYLHSCERDFIKQLQSLNGKMSDDKDLNSNTKEASNENDNNIHIENTDTTGNANKNVYYCDICDMNLDNINNVKTHYEGKTHKSNLDKTFIEPPKETHYLMEAKNKAFQCIVCRVSVPNNIQNIQDHIGGRNHNTTYTFLLNFNKIKKVNKSYYCEICNVNVRETLEIDHINTSSHITKRSNHPNKTVNNKKGIAIVKSEPKTEDNNKTNVNKVNSVNNYYCDVCEVGVPNHQHNIKEHTSGLRHQANVNRIISNHSISLKKKNTYYCDLCKLFFSKASVMKHVQSEKHKSLLAK